MKQFRYLKSLIVAVLLLASVQLISCNDYRQFRTYSDMQLMAAYIRENVSKTNWSPESIRPEIEKVNSGRDAWGHEIILLVDQRGYLLVSPGSDGKIDVDDPVEYFLMQEENIHSDITRDIVFLNGFAMTNAGK